MRERDVATDKPQYEKPEVQSEEVFETLALACSKADQQCTAPGGAPAVQS